MAFVSLHVFNTPKHTEMFTQCKTLSLPLLIFFFFWLWCGLLDTKVFPGAEICALHWMCFQKTLTSACVA